MCTQERAICRIFMLVMVVFAIIASLSGNDVSKVVRKSLWSLLFHVEPRNHYERLGVSRQASTREIKKAYRAKSLKVGACIINLVLIAAHYDCCSRASTLHTCTYSVSSRQSFRELGKRTLFENSGGSCNPIQ